MSIEDRIGDWNKSLPRVYTPVRQDPDTILLDGLDDEDRQLILDARERKAAGLAGERVQPRPNATGSEPERDRG